MLKTLTTSQLEHVLLLVEEAHKATSPQALRQTIVYGVGTLMDSLFCTWTELSTDLFETKVANTTAADINSDDFDIDQALLLFNRYAWQHPAISQVIKMDELVVLSISELISQPEYKNLELYSLFYALHGIEDQLSAGYVENGYVKGFSVNRGAWGFSENERNLLTHIARSVFPFYRMLQNNSGTEQHPVIEMNINTIAIHHKALGITPREAELLTLVAHGKSNKQISQACNISEGTVRKHLENTYRRLGVNNRVSAINKSMTTIQGLKGAEIHETSSTL